MTKTQQEVIDIVKNNDPQEFEKFGLVAFRTAKIAELVETVIDGKKETEKMASPGDAIITGSKNENYTISKEKFSERYNVIGEYLAQPIGKCYGNVYNGEPFTFEAPWKEEMICEDGDYLVSPDDKFSEAYRIEKSGFSNTYKKV